MDEIVRHVWVGNMGDGRDAPGDVHVLCVMWKGEPEIPARAHHIETTGYSKDPSDLGVWALPEKMDEAADWIHERVVKDEDVLVHCAYGVERSPLTVVWYLMRHHGMDFKQAYDRVLFRRKVAQYRGAWMPQSVKVTGQLPVRTQEADHARVLLVLKGVLEEDDLALKAAAELVYDDVPAQPAQGGA